VSGVLLVPSTSVVGEDKAEVKPAAAAKKPDKKAQKQAGKKADKKAAGAKQASPRLPRHYGDVVTEDQRERIATAFAKYNAKLAKLRSEIKAMTAERDQTIEGMLTAEQKSKLAKLKADAQAKRKTANK